jgi:hypothetical protein
MQDNQLTLSVDAANDGNPGDETYTRYEEYQNRSAYIGADHLPDARNTLGIYRTFPTKSGNFKGTGKSAVKFTQDVEVPGVDSSVTLTAPIILDLSFSVPVGVAQADLVHLRQRLLALLDDDTFMDSLNIQLMV